MVVCGNSSTARSELLSEEIVRLCGWRCSPRRRYFKYVVSTPYFVTCRHVKVCTVHAILCDVDMVCIIPVQAILCDVDIVKVCSVHALLCDVDICKVEKDVSKSVNCFVLSAKIAIPSDAVLEEEHAAGTSLRGPM
ncbi:hypothetical protein Btru_023770 [Bulinus truncatus]|nr:hypothetical protein Btru_023770 [Bulinus truncatus]